MNAASDPTSFIEKLCLSMNKGNQFSGTNTFASSTGPGTGFNSAFGFGNMQQKPQSTFTFGQQNTATSNSGVGQTFGQTGFGLGTAQQQQQQQTFGAFNTTTPAQQQFQGANTQQLVSLIGDMIKRQVADTQEPHSSQPSVASIATEASVLETSLSKILTNVSSASASIRLSAVSRKPGAPQESLRLLDDKNHNRFGMSSASTFNAAAARAAAAGLLPRGPSESSESIHRQIMPLNNPTVIHINKNEVPTASIPSYYEHEDDISEADSEIKLLSAPNAHKPIITRADYRTVPPISELHAMSIDQLQAVKDFQVISEANGEIMWPGETDLTDVNIDKIVDIGYKSATVYPNTLPYLDRHRRGEKLNKEAIITLYNIFPVNKGERVYDLPSVQKFTAIIANETKKRDAELISYSPNDGIWKFSVNFFI